MKQARYRKKNNIEIPLSVPFGLQVFPQVRKNEEGVLTCYLYSSGGNLIESVPVKEYWQKCYWLGPLGGYTPWIDDKPPEDLTPQENEAGYATREEK